MNPKEFRFGPSGLKMLRERLIATTVILALFLVSFTGLLISLENNRAASRTFTWTYLACVLVIYLGYFLFRSYRRSMRRFRSYCLYIEDGQLRRQMEGFPDLVIPFHEISGIVRRQNGLLIYGKTNHPISVSSFLDDYASLEREVFALLPGADHLSPAQRYRPLLVLLNTAAFLGLLIGMHSSKDKMVIAICGIGAIGLMIYMFFIASKNPNAPYVSAGRGIYRILLIVIIAVNLLMKLIDFNGLHRQPQPLPPPAINAALRTTPLPPSF
jgi:hypothetical protein